MERKTEGELRRRTLSVPSHQFDDAIDKAYSIVNKEDVNSSIDYLYFRIRVAIVFFVIVSLSVSGLEGNLGLRGAYELPLAVFFLPLAAVVLLTVLSKLKIIDHENILPRYIPSPLFIPLFLAYVLLLIQRVMSLIDTGCGLNEIRSWSPDSTPTEIHTGEVWLQANSPMCAATCPFNTSYRFQRGADSENRTLTKTRVACMNRSYGGGNLLLIITLVCLMAAVLFNVDSTEQNNQIRHKFDSIIKKWPLVEIMLNGSALNIKSMMNTASKPTWKECIGGIGLGLAGSCGRLVDLATLVSQPTAVDIVFVVLGILANMGWGIVIYVLLFWRPFMVYNAVLLQMEEMEIFIRGKAYSMRQFMKLGKVHTPLYKLPGNTNFIVSDKYQLRSWMIARHFLLDFFPAAYGYAATATNIVMVSFIVSFTWAVTVIAMFYWNGVSPFETFSRNPGNLCELFAISIVLCTWALHLIKTISDISYTQAHHAVELKRAWLSIQLQPDYVYDKERKDLIETISSHIQTDDEYPMVLAQIEVKPHTLVIAMGYVLTGLTAILSFQVSTASSASSSTSMPDASQSATVPMGIMFALVGLNLVLHGLYVFFLMPQPSQRLLLLENDRVNPMGLVGVEGSHEVTQTQLIQMTESSAQDV